MLAVVPFLSACGGGGSGSGGNVKQEITVNAASEPPSLDPALATDTTSGWVIDHLFEGLYTKNKDGDIVPGLAKSMKVSKDHKVYTVKLRDAKWSNGDPVTAGDFEYEWKRVLDPKTGSPFAFYLYYLKGAEDYNKGKGSADNVGVKAVDDKTLKIELKSPTGFFKKLLAFWSYYPVDQSVVKGNKNWAAEAKGFVSDGAYTLKSWEHDNKLVAEKSNKYWNKKTISMNQITWKMVNDSTTYYQMYKSGELDMISSLPVDVISQEKGNKDYKSTPYFGTYMYMFNVKKKPFNNPKVREAFNLAIDRKSITKNISQGGETPAYAFVPPGVKTPKGDFRAQKDKYFSEDVKKAQATAC